MNIIREDGVCLRFSRYDCLNDTSEGREAVAIQQEVCEELKAEYGGSQEKIDLLDRISMIRPDFKSINIGESVPVPKEELKDGCLAAARITIRAVLAVPYICSFSRERDALTMWNYYTKGTHYEGYNIGIDVEDICLEVIAPNVDEGEHGDNPGTCLSDLPRDACSCDRLRKPELKCEWWGVIYDKCQQKDKIRMEIERILSDGQFKENEYTAQLNNWAIRFKNEIFRHEKEERLICYVPENESESGATLDDYIQFRVVNGCLVPYLDILISDKKALKEINIGPLIEENLAKNTIELYLKLKDYNGVEIHTSNAPIRY